MNSKCTPHKSGRCALCAPLRHPSQTKVRRALDTGLARQSRTNGENRGRS
mgnify:FL=1